VRVLDLTDLHRLERELSEDHIKLTAFTRQAHLELKHNIARLFEALSFSKQVQAIFVLKHAGCIKDTKRNIDEYLNNVNLCDAQKNEMPDAGMDTIAKFDEMKEKNRHLYISVLDSLDAGMDINIGSINVCSKCGYLLLGDAPKECMMCHAPSGYFRIF